MMLSPKIWHVPIHKVTASVAFPQVELSKNANVAIPQGPHKASILSAKSSAVYKYKALLKLKLMKRLASGIAMVARLGGLQRCLT